LGYGAASLDTYDFSVQRIGRALGEANRGRAVPAPILEWNQSRMGSAHWSEFSVPSSPWVRYYRTWLRNDFACNGWRPMCLDDGLWRHDLRTHWLLCSCSWPAWQGWRGCTVTRAVSNAPGPTRASSPADGFSPFGGASCGKVATWRRSQRSPNLCRIGGSSCPAILSSARIPQGSGWWSLAAVLRSHSHTRNRDLLGGGRNRGRPRMERTRLAGRRNGARWPSTIGSFWFYWSWVRQRFSRAGYSGEL